MPELATPDPYGTPTEPDTLEIRRLLPGLSERVWGYLTESELRWHAHLDMLVACASSTKPAPFWDGFSRLLHGYDR